MEQNNKKETPLRDLSDDDDCAGYGNLDRFTANINRECGSKEYYQDMVEKIRKDFVEKNNKKI